jgi:hypothetical protein
LTPRWTNISRYSQIPTWATLDPEASAVRPAKVCTYAAFVPDRGSDRRRPSRDVREPTVREW